MISGIQRNAEEFKCKGGNKRKISCLSAELVRYLKEDVSEPTENLLVFWKRN